MATRIRCHFDGKALVPEEPLDLEVGRAVYVTVLPSGADVAAEGAGVFSAGGAGGTMQDLLKSLESLPAPDRGEGPRFG